MKPQLADNWDETKIKVYLDSYAELWAQPKVDGVRGLYITSQFTGRSLKAFKNKALTQYYSASHFSWLDGELVLSDNWTQERLCSLTTGLCNTVKATEIPQLVAFDYLAPELIRDRATYRQRYLLLAAQVSKLEILLGQKMVHLMPNLVVKSFQQLLDLDAQWLDMGYEGTIIRNPDAVYKEGRPGSSTMELMRIKRFIDVEARCVGLYEAMENTNEAKTNELGRSERSTHQENMVPKGMVGGLDCVIEKDVYHNNELLFAKDMLIKVGPGEMDHSERKYYWQNQHEIVGKVIKFKTFPKGVKTKPRMPIFLSIRAAEDIS